MRRALDEKRCVFESAIAVCIRSVPHYIIHAKRNRVGLRK